jgi:hypothetical protein
MAKAGRPLIGVVLLSAALHAVGIARTSLPSQDGLKFLAVARQFRSQPWSSVIRGTDRHPLYPLCIAGVEPLVSALRGPGPDSERLAAQCVSAGASVLLLWPLFGFARRVFDERTALLCCLLYAVLPLSVEVGHDTLSDPLALLLFTLALYFGQRAWTSGSLSCAIACGLAAGLGYWTRPEVAVVAAVITALGVVRVVPGVLRRSQIPDRGSPIRTGGLSRMFCDPRSVICDLRSPRTLNPALLTACAFLAVVGVYALVKGEVSEKLALRRTAAIPSVHDTPRSASLRLPSGLDGRRWDFAPKEESDAPRPAGLIEATLRALLVGVEASGWVLAPFALWAGWRVRSGPGRAIALAYLLLFGAVLVRHAAIFGYLSSRHALSLVIVTLPWAAAGLIDVLGKVARRRGARRVAVALMVLVGLSTALRPLHASRWGHLQAGRWLEACRGPAEAILDTRGWAAFVAGEPTYDPWHVGQALSDRRLAYIVIGADELNAPSRRAETWRSLLAFTSNRVAAFPAREGGAGEDVLVYRFHPPDSWEDLAR